ncbi:alpha/beta fold hydrolase [Agrobacterium vitis]|uniref:alpha/beta hydrolase n=1 Tax=Rhizobium/Agrobacterium group TaxID=227290 RepID=UPI0008DC0E9D|nr:MULTISPECIES: alpha/beta hydrolase [Rhizobium/Agrobacterium group]MCF1435737.1 alpha/beta hydrolase [Allorhizobium ampelinum]MUO90335.1 alpha/beta fold hydrolase [Agrobacterium vitis]MUZ52347.1 alpha/beta fold hydrolase [Agrobacterium vitis]MUZ91604.1 alpha/beta fold hydrolase [Agrobacterium vitis]MVA39692.1 alpha/beta fold hydrolase [Agrobacterium vitis]
MTNVGRPIETHAITVGQGSDARSIAALVRAPAQDERPTCIWLGGYRSDMTGTKALEMDDLAASLGVGAIRFDYSGHGASGGAFRDGTISRWLEEALAVLDHFKPEKAILVGSSMGGWIALRLIQELKARHDNPTQVSGMVLIAPAPDLTSDLIEPLLGDRERKDLAEKGYFEEISEYSPEPNIFTRALMEDGRANRVMSGMIDTGCPVHILQGMADPDVPYQHALKLVEHLPADDVVLTLVRDGDHRLSRPQDIDRMRNAIRAMIEPRP